MLFNTIDFAVFLPVILVLYYAIPHKFRWILLLIASYYFYMCWKVEYVFLIVISTLIDYLAGLMMERASDRKSRLPWLVASLITNLGFLFFFKYYNFVSLNLNNLFHATGLSTQLPLMDFLLPVGISFYTFQTLSYSIDVYYGRQKAEKHLGYFALYVSYFPQLVAGPIERFSRLTPQLKAQHPFSSDNLIKGLRLILYGLFIKMVIADNISGIVDQVYQTPEHFSSLDILKGLFFYSLQIYSDFYGYSVIAIGASLIMGIHLMDNFKTPYLAKSISEFWQRWHISLSTWFRDYLYYPLGGNRVKISRWAFNIFVVFVVSGVWHGANWTFLIWGSLYGLVYLAERGINRFINMDKECKPFSIRHLLLALKTFILVTVIWVFFRSQSFDEALNIFRLLSHFDRQATDVILIPQYIWFLTIVFIISDLALYNERFDGWLSKVHVVGRWLIYAFLIFSIVVYAGVENFPFIYFQF